MTPIEFHYALKEANRYETAQLRTQYEAARLVAFNIWNSSGRTLKKMEARPERLVPLPWDSEKDVPVQTEEEMKTVLEGLSIQFGIKMGTKK